MKAKRPKSPEGRHEKQAAAATQCAAPVVSSEERRHLAECCAFFKAEQYREVEPGTIRESDVRKAEEEIDCVIKHSAIDGKSPERT